MFPIHLSPGELVQERPFTHPQFTWEDARTMQGMLHSLLRLVRHKPAHSHIFSAGGLYEIEPDGRQHRFIIAQPQRLLKLAPVYLVGFFGQRQPQADSGPVDDVDERLIAEFPQHPDLLSYSTLQLSHGNSGNVVLFATPEAKHHWNTSSIHAEAVRQLAPSYYQSVRLYNGVVPDGLTAPESLRVERVKYYDFRHQPWWHAIRPV